MIFTAATALLACSGGAACFADDGNLTDAAATLMGNSARDFYKTLTDTGVTLDRKAFIEGMVKVFEGDTLGGFTLESAQAAIRRATTPPSLPPAVADADEAAEIAWVESKAALPGAEVLEGGVVLQRLREGQGEHPAPGSAVEVMYTGRLSNGFEFDHTDEPFVLPLDHLITGLARAIEHMRFGGSYRVFIPPALGYGSEAVMDLIPANSALDFTIEL